MLHSSRRYVLQLHALTVWTMCGTQPRYLYARGRMGGEHAGSLAPSVPRRVANGDSRQLHRWLSSRTTVIGAPCAVVESGRFCQHGRWLPGHSNDDEPPVRALRGAQAQMPQRATDIIPSLCSPRPARHGQRLDHSIGDGCTSDTVSTYRLPRQP